MEEAGTWVCWSIDVMLRTANRDLRAIHIQGDTFGKIGRTLCGRPYGQHWDFEAHTYPPSQFNGCDQCAAVYRKLMGKCKTDNSR